MSAEDSGNWPAWISASVAGLGGIIVILKSFFVTHAHLRQFFKDRDEERLRMHEENQESWRTLATDMAEVKSSVSRLEGVMSGRYPRIKR